MKIVFFFFFLVNLLKQIDQSQECILVNTEDCIKKKDCCNIQINNERMCMSKKNLFDNYSSRIKFLYSDKTNDELNFLVDFDYNYEDSICKKWVEMNDSFFNDMKIFSDCMCKSSEFNIFLIFKLVFFLYFY